MARYHKSSKQNKKRMSGECMRDMAGYHEKEYMENAIETMKGREATGYEGYDASKRLMRRDSQMIAEDRNAACLLPTHVIEKQWPMAGDYMHKGIGSLFSGVQETMKEDGKAFEKSNKPRQY